MTPPETTLDSRLIKALGHPLRQRLLLQYHEQVTSPRAVSEALGEPLGNVAYHTRILVEADTIELIRTEPRRGALEHFYGAKVRPWITDDQWKDLPVGVRRGIFGDILGQIQKDVLAAAAAERLDDLETHVSRSPLRLDPQGWEEMTALLAQTLDDALRIHGESITRMGVDDEDAIETELALLHFKRAS